MMRMRCESFRDVMFLRWSAEVCTAESPTIPDMIDGGEYMVSICIRFASAVTAISPSNQIAIASPAPSLIGTGSSGDISEMIVVLHGRIPKFVR